MIAPVDIQECVCFVYIKRGGKNKAIGTAFFLGIEVAPEHYTAIVITAMHVIVKGRGQADDGQIYLRVNRPGDGADFVMVETWEMPDQSSEAVDIAAALWPYSRAEYDFKFTTIDHVATLKVIEENVIGPGDEVFFPGLFVNHHGHRRNVPIMRIGNIASMPVERVATQNLGAVEAFLVEARSVGGLSGSPVFVQLGIVRPQSDKPGAVLDFHTAKRTWYLLGVMHGHWDAPTEDLTVNDGMSKEYINMGIAVVTPATKLVDLLEVSPLKGALDIIGERTREALAPTPDIVATDDY